MKIQLGTNEELADPKTVRKYLESQYGTVRILAGEYGVVTGGSSKTLGLNLMKEMDCDAEKWSSYQAQHIMPKHLKNHPVIQKVGMDFDDASNGIFLRERYSVDTSVKSRHQGGHKVYDKVWDEYVNDLSPDMDVSDLEVELYDMQQASKRIVEQGVPIYPIDNSPLLKSDIGTRSYSLLGDSPSLRTENLIKRMLSKYGNK